jgi:TNF receptor-associated protein 1
LTYSIYFSASCQDKKLLSKLKQVLSKRVIRWMNDEAKKDEEKYRGFYEQFVMYLKEGVATDQANSKDLMKLLRYSTSAQEDDKLTSLKEYVDRMKPDQEAIYYLVTSDRKAALASPYYEAFKRAGVEVIFCYALHDEIVMGNADAFEGKSLKSIEVAEPPEMEEDKEEEREQKDGEDGEKKDGDDAKPESGKKKLTSAEAEE